MLTSDRFAQTVFPSQSKPFRTIHQLFAEGKDNASTGSGILYVAELALNSTIPAGSWIIGHRIAIQTTGGNET